MSSAMDDNVTEARTWDSEFTRAYAQAFHHIFFQSGCCIPTIHAYWMLLVMVLSFILLISCFCGMACVAKWIYKRRLRKRREKYLAKYKDEEASKKQLQIRTNKQKIESNAHVNLHGNHNRVNELEQDVKLARMSQQMISREWAQPNFMQRGPSCENQLPLKSMKTGSNNQPQLPLFLQHPLPIGTSALVNITSTTMTASTGGASTSAGTTGTTGTTVAGSIGATVAGSRMSVASAGEEDSRFEMEHETFAAVVGTMAQNCDSERLKKKELRNKPPILHSKNPRRVDGSLDKSGLSSQIDSNMDSDSAPTTPKESIDDLKKNVASPSELSVSIPTVSFDDEDGGKKKSKKAKKKAKDNKKAVKKAATVPPKQPSLTTIEENEEYQPEYSDSGMWNTGATFPYYKDSSAKTKTNRVNQIVSPSVRTADNCMSTTATTRMTESDRTTPSSESTASRIPNVYQLRQELNNQRKQFAQSEQDLVEERQTRMKNRIRSSNGVIDEAPGHGRLDNDRNAYETKKMNQNSPYEASKHASDEIRSIDSSYHLWWFIRRNDIRVV